MWWYRIYVWCFSLDLQLRTDSYVTPPSPLAIQCSTSSKSTPIGWPLSDFQWQSSAEEKGIAKHNLYGTAYAKYESDISVNICLQSTTNKLQYHHQQSWNTGCPIILSRSAGITYMNQSRKGFVTPCSMSTSIDREDLMTIVQAVARRLASSFVLFLTIEMWE